LDVLLANQSVLLYGGARSGKTALAVYFLVYCALTFPGIRMLIARRYATDIRGSIWNDTMVKIPRLLGLDLGAEYKTNEQLMTMSFPNGSEIICAGLDDKERIDKILGTEYGIIYVNESQDVAWATIKLIRTRLAQRVTGFRNRFICDLNPTSVNHWTYSLWIEGRNPETGEPLKGTYGCIQMNPYDNKENLGEGFIEDQLEGLTGEERKRFLLGEYSTNSDLQVLKPTSVHQDLEADFIHWAHGRWRQVQVTGALDLGFEDADAYINLAYIDGEPDVWLIKEYKERKNDISTLAKDVKGCILDVRERYPMPPSAMDSMDIWTDTGGLGRKTAVELAEAFELPIRAAYKRDKDVGLFFVQDDCNHGRLHIQKDGEFHQETKKVVFKRNKDTGKVEQIIDSDAYHPDLLDAVIYAYRFLMKHGNEAMMGRQVEAIKEREDKTFYDIQAEVERALGLGETVW
jgi:PBSX family phage terminase large subunit